MQQERRGQCFAAPPTNLNSLKLFALWNHKCRMLGLPNHYYLFLYRIIM